MRVAFVPIPLSTCPFKQQPLSTPLASHTTGYLALQEVLQNVPPPLDPHAIPCLPWTHPLPPPPPPVLPPSHPAFVAPVAHLCPYLHALCPRCPLPFSLRRPTRLYQRARRPAKATRAPCPGARPPNPSPICPHPHLWDTRRQRRPPPPTHPPTHSPTHPPNLPPTHPPSHPPSLSLKPSHFPPAAIPIPSAHTFLPRCYALPSAARALPVRRVYPLAPWSPPCAALTERGAPALLCVCTPDM